ncbi:hypothetical protein L484_021424 [Morus notabilis]|uniref:Uncharacterized protein n=1 Tax=Morus notabilis TaxID=981085 RepID=W9RXJ0_9ROSA|nr:hypothetical protein L484_021424 [Morus notabilis]
MKAMFSATRSQASAEPHKPIREREPSSLAEPTSVRVGPSISSVSSLFLARVTSMSIFSARVPSTQLQCVSNSSAVWVPRLQPSAGLPLHVRQVSNLVLHFARASTVQPIRPRHVARFLLTSNHVATRVPLVLNPNSFPKNQSKLPDFFPNQIYDFS